MHYAWPLLRKQVFTADDGGGDAFGTAPLAWVCKCWRAISTTGLTQAKAAQTGHLPGPSEGRNGRPGAAYRRRRYQCIATIICDVVSNTLTAEPSRFTGAVDKILNRFLGLPIFVRDVPDVSCSPLTSGGALQPLFDAGSVAIFIHGIQWIGYTLHFRIEVNHLRRRSWRRDQYRPLPLVPQIGMMYLFLSLP